MGKIVLALTEVSRFLNRIFKVLKHISKDCFSDFFYITKIKEQIRNTHYIVMIQGYASKEHSLNIAKVYSKFEEHSLKLIIQISMFETLTNSLISSTMRN